MHWSLNHTIQDPLGSVLLPRRQKGMLLSPPSDVCQWGLNKISPNLSIPAFTSLSIILFASIMSRFLGPMSNGDYSSPGRVRKPVSLLEASSAVRCPSNTCLLHWPTFLWFLVSLSTTRSALGGSSDIALTTDGIVSPAIPYLVVHPPTMMRCR